MRSVKTSPFGKHLDEIFTCAWQQKQSHKWPFQRGCTWEDGVRSVIFIFFLFFYFWSAVHIDRLCYRWVPVYPIWTIRIPGYFEVLQESHSCLRNADLPTLFEYRFIQIFTWSFFFGSSGRYLYLFFGSHPLTPAKDKGGCSCWCLQKTHSNFRTSLSQYNNSLNNFITINRVAKLDKVRCASTTRISTSRSFPHSNAKTESWTLIEFITFGNIGLWY